MWIAQFVCINTHVHTHAHIHTYIPYNALHFQLQTIWLLQKQQKKYQQTLIWYAPLHFNTSVASRATHTHTRAAIQHLFRLNTFVTIFEN